MRKLKNANIAVLGLGIDTQDVIPYLKKKGAKISVLDEAKGDKFDNLERFDLIVRSPGVYRFRPEIIFAEKNGVEISSKTKLFFDIFPGRIIGVTGTKGKGTTSTLIYEILKAAGKKVFLGGNIGTGLFDHISKSDKSSLVVLELSSFQLVDLHRSPHIAVVLMITSEHLDWHKDTKEYIDAKKNIVSHQTENDFAVINDDFPNSQLIGREGKGEKLYFSRRHGVEKGCFLMQKTLMYRYIKNKNIIVHHDEIKLRGEHNIENIMAATVAARLAGVPPVKIRQVVKTFKGLEHRLEEVATVNDVSYYNDSFSTTPETAIAAIKAFTEPKILILGGSSKKSDFSALIKEIGKAKNIKAVILVGTERKKLLKLLRPLKRLKILTGARNMAEIIKMAYNNAISGDIVLLSPACASFDMFKNYKDRGKQFKDQVQKLKINEKS